MVINSISCSRWQRKLARLQQTRSAPPPESPLVKKTIFMLLFTNQLQHFAGVLSEQGFAVDHLAKPSTLPCHYWLSIRTTAPSVSRDRSQDRIPKYGRFACILVQFLYSSQIPPYVVAWEFDLVSGKWKTKCSPCSEKCFFLVYRLAFIPIHTPSVMDVITIWLKIGPASMRWGKYGFGRRGYRVMTQNVFTDDGFNVARTSAWWINSCTTKLFPNFSSTSERPKSCRCLVLRQSCISAHRVRYWCLSSFFTTHLPRSNNDI